MKLEDLRPRHVRELHQALTTNGSPVLANRVVSTIRAMLNWACRRDDWAITVNAAAGIATNREEPRERYPARTASCSASSTHCRRATTCPGATSCSCS